MKAENEAFVRDFPQKVKVEDVKTKLSCETSLKSESWRCENKAFVQDFPQKLKVEDVKTKRSCKTSLKNWKLKMWKQSVRARLCSKRRRCENDAFVRDDLALRSSHSLLPSPWDHLTLISTRSHLTHSEILSPSAQLSRSDESAKVTKSQEGDYFGENALLRDEPRTATIQASLGSRNCAGIYLYRCMMYVMSIVVCVYIYTHTHRFFFCTHTHIDIIPIYTHMYRHVSSWWRFLFGWIRQHCVCIISYLYSFYGLLSLRSFVLCAPFDVHCLSHVCFWSFWPLAPLNSQRWRWKHV